MPYVRKLTSRASLGSRIDGAEVSAAVIRSEDLELVPRITGVLTMKSGTPWRSERFRRKT
jgi:hypothetical protein